MDISEFSEMADSYEPCDPNSQPDRELRDYIIEPVEQWNLEHDGPISEETMGKTIEAWKALGDPVLDEEAIPVDVQEELDHLDPAALRQVQPAPVKQFTEKLEPMVFESIGLASIPLDLLARIESDPVIVGQMFGVPRDEGWVPVLSLETTIAGGLEHALDQTHGFFHLLNDCFTEDPTEIVVMM